MTRLGDTHTHTHPHMGWHTVLPSLAEPHPEEDEIMIKALYLGVFFRLCGIVVVFAHTKMDIVPKVLG